MTYSVHRGPHWEAQAPGELAQDNSEEDECDIPAERTPQFDTKSPLKCKFMLPLRVRIDAMPEPETHLDPICPDTVSRSGRDIAEVILECIHACGIDLSSLPPERCAIAFSIDQCGNGFRKLVGRAHQPCFFETLVPREELLLCISRSHFELNWSPSQSEAKLTRESKAPLSIGGSMVAIGKMVPVVDGTLVNFHVLGELDVETSFLVLRVMLRSRRAVQLEGEHPATVSTQQDGASMPCRGNSILVGATLECVSAVGSDLDKCPPAAKVLGLVLDQWVEVGRSSQPSFFEQLLRTEPNWLNYISRRHLRVQLCSSDDEVCVLSVQNLSANIVYIQGRPLMKNQYETMSPGDIISFAAMASDKEVRFLEFILRRREVTEEERREALQRPFYEVIHASMARTYEAAACESGSLCQEALFQQWLRQFHSERDDEWFLNNRTRLENAFRPHWDRLFSGRLVDSDCG